MDSVTEKAIQASLDDAMTGKTVVVVAHRLSTIAHLDRILVFENGRIVEDGSPAALLARKGAFHRLWKGQADGFVSERSLERDNPVDRLPSSASAKSVADSGEEPTDSRDADASLASSAAHAARPSPVVLSQKQHCWPDAGIPTSRQAATSRTVRLS